MIEVPVIECVAGRGIRGDRYFDFKDDYKGQITFFSLDVFDELCAELKLHDCSPAAARRNVITRGVDLNDLHRQGIRGSRGLFIWNGGVQAVLLDGRSIRAGSARILERPRRSARQDSERRRAALDGAIDRGHRRALCSRLSLPKGEGRVRVCSPAITCSRRTPHLNPLPFKKRRGGFSGSRKRALARCCLPVANRAGWARTKRRCRIEEKRSGRFNSNCLRQLTPQEIFVSARSDPDWRPAGIQFVADDPPSRGPLSGLAASLDRMSTSHLLALAIDMPWMSNKYLEFLCAQIEPGLRCCSENRQPR